MGLFDFLKPKKPKIEPVVEPVKVEQPQPIEIKKHYSPLSMLELSRVDWNDFGAKVKSKNLLPSSFSKNPVDVQITLSADNMPCAMLTFVSESMGSTRKIEITENKVTKINNQGKVQISSELTKLWEEYKDFINCAISLNRRREVVMNKQRAKYLQGIDADNKELIESLTNFAQFFEEEDKFLSKYKNDTFDILSYHGDDYTLCFSKFSNMGVSGSNHIVPFSPKTLEFCVARLAEEEKHCIAHNIINFKEKCKQLENSSIYKTKDWEKTVDMLCEVISERYKDKTTHHSHREEQHEPENI